MRTRESSYDFYGFRAGEEEQLLTYIKQGGATTKRLVYEASALVDERIGDYLYFSIIEGVSYDKMLKVTYIPLGRKDFYGYRRKVLAMVRGRLETNGVWNVKEHRYLGGKNGATD